MLKKEAFMITDDIKRFERDRQIDNDYHNAWRERLSTEPVIVYIWAGINSDEIMPDWIKEQTRLDCKLL